MIRYTGQPLPPGPRIAVIANDALGNFVVSTPLLQMLRAAHAPSALDYFGGPRTEELERASSLIDDRFSLVGGSLADAVHRAVDRGSDYDLVVNLERAPWAMFAASLLAKRSGFVCGPAAGAEGRGELPPADDKQGRLSEDRDWTAEDLTKRHSIIKRGWIGEIFCRLAYLKGAVPMYRLPSAEPPRAIPPILIATAGSGADKLWGGWVPLLETLQTRGLGVGLLGARPETQRAYWRGEDVEGGLVGNGLAEDLRGALTLPQVVGALAGARAVVTLDNGIMHLAAAAGAPSVGLFRAGIHRLWAPPVRSLTVLIPEPGAPVSSIPVDAVLEALDERL